MVSLRVIRQGLGFILLMLVVLGCGKELAPEASQELGDRRYTVIVTAPPELHKGASGLLVVEARPEAGHKLSTEFPTRLLLTSSAGLGIPAQLDREAAEELAEQTIRYTTPIFAKHDGKQTIQGAFRVGVCTGDLCEPVELPFEISVRVREGS